MSLGFNEIGFYETERPTEWLRNLVEDRNFSARLLRESGSFARAAYRVARARCRCASTPMTVPTLRELEAAALELRDRVSDLQHLGSAWVLADECEASGLPVITPLPPRIELK